VEFFEFLAGGEIYKFELRIGVRDSQNMSAEQKRSKAARKFIQGRLRERYSGLKT